MKASDSTSSLTQLRDTACILCSETAGEKGAEGPLVDSKQVVKCGCSYVVHLSCWSYRMEEGHRDCPSCGKSIVPPYILKALEHSGIEETEQKGGFTRQTIALVIFSIACVIAFIIGITVTMRK